MTHPTQTPVHAHARTRVTAVSEPCVTCVTETKTRGAGLLALDLGDTPGRAVPRPDGFIPSGTATFRPGWLEGGGMAWLRFRHWRDGMAVTAGPLCGGVSEEVRCHTDAAAGHIFGGVLAHLTAWYEASSVPGGTMHRFAIGMGNAKEAVIAVAWLPQAVTDEANRRRGRPGRGTRHGR
jgi:hypothetical protein